MDEELRMLEYWVEENGIESAFCDYYPELAQHDREIKQALFNMRGAKQILMHRVRYLTEQAQVAYEQAQEARDGGKAKP